MEQRGIFLSSNNQYLPANTVSRRQCTEDTEEHQQMFSSILIIRFCISKMAWPGLVLTRQDWRKERMSQVKWKRLKTELKPPV